jgi:hypothetical protein
LKRWLATQNDVGRTFHELYVLEIDGVKQSEHRVFIEALKRGLELKRQCPRSDVKLRDANDNASRDGAPAPNRTRQIGRANVGSELEVPVTKRPGP